MNIAAENLELISRAKNGDKAAEEELIQKNIGLVHSTLKHFQNSRLEYDDMFQAGCLGLLKAARGFDESKGVMFSTYAVCVISGEIKRLIRDDTPIKMSRHLREISMRVNKAKNKLVGQLGREPTLSEVAEVTGDSVDDILMSIEANSCMISFDDPVDDEDNDTSISEIIGHDPTEKLSENLALHSALSSLPILERQIVALRFFGGKTQQDTADALNISQVQVSRKEKKILRQLKEMLE